MLKAVHLLQLTWKPLQMSVRNHPYPHQFLHFLRNIPETQVTVLPNGLRVASETRETYNTCVGLYIDAGSRYESAFENGIAHFFEHIAFKSTRARRRDLLEQQMASIGARFKCQLDREMVTYYCDCLCQDLPLAVDLLSDCVFNNCFSPADIENEKKTVYCEMIEHDCNNKEVVMDYLHATAFQGTPLGQNIIGPSGNLYNFNEMTVSRYVARCFDPTRTVLVAVGGVTHEQIVCLANTFLSRLQPVKCVDDGPYRFTGSDVRYRDDSMPVGYAAIAVEGPCFCDDDSVVMDVAAALVGGWDRSQAGGSNHAARVARVASGGRLCDSYQAFNIGYKDTGLWGVLFMGPSLDLDDMWLNVQDEWMNLCSMVTDGELYRAKREAKIKLLCRTESAVGTCHDIGRWVLYNGHRPPVHERMCTIDNVHAAQVKEVCTKYLYDRCPAVAAIGACEGLFEYTRIRAGMYWLRV